MTLLDPAARPGAGAADRPPHRRPRLAHAALLATVLVCAACGLVYELALTALGGALSGDPVTDTSLVLSVMVAAMGAGSLAAKPLIGRPAVAFAGIEIVLGVLGGVCVTVLDAVHAWTGGHRLPLVLAAAVLGVLVGAEIPLLMTLVERVRRQTAGHAAANLFAADYLGALAGGLLFPFVLLPWLGPVRTVVLAGMVNAAAGAALVLGPFRGDLGRRGRVLLAWACAVALAVLVLTALHGRAHEPDLRPGHADVTGSPRVGHSA